MYKISNNLLKFSTFPKAKNQTHKMKISTPRRVRHWGWYQVNQLEQSLNRTTKLREGKGMINNRGICIWNFCWLFPFPSDAVWLSHERKRIHIVLSMLHCNSVTSPFLYKKVKAQRERERERERATPSKMTTGAFGHSPTQTLSPVTRIYETTALRFSCAFARNPFPSPFFTITTTILSTLSLFPLSLSLFLSRWLSKPTLRTPEVCKPIVTHQAFHRQQPLVVISFCPRQVSFAEAQRSFLRFFCS